MVGYEFSVVWDGVDWMAQCSLLNGDTRSMHEGRRFPIKHLALEWVNGHVHRHAGTALVESRRASSK